MAINSNWFFHFNAIACQCGEKNIVYIKQVIRGTVYRLSWMSREKKKTSFMKWFWVNVVRIFMFSDVLMKLTKYMTLLLLLLPFCSRFGHMTENFLRLQYVELNHLFSWSNKKKPHSLEANNSNCFLFFFISWFT